MKIGILALILLCAACEQQSDAPATGNTAQSAKATQPGHDLLDEQAKEACGAKDGDERTNCLLKMADARVAAGKDVDALPLYMSAVTAAPKNLTAWLKLTSLIVAADDYEQAAAVMSEAKCHAEKDKVALVHQELGALYQQSGELDKAIVEYEATRKLEPKDPVVLFTLGMAHAKLTPPNKANAALHLTAFLDATCKSKDDARRFRSECQYASNVMVKLGDGDHGKPTEPPAAEAPKCGKEVKLPKIKLATGAITDGDAYTVWGAAHHLRTAALEKQVTKEPIPIVGYVVATNYAEAPECAIFMPGKKDTPPDCDAPIPSFSLADKKDGSGAQIKVIGWASNWSYVLDTMTKVDDGADMSDHLDPFTGEPIPHPVPNVGAKLKVTGKYNFSAFSASVGVKGISIDPRYGILSFNKLEVLEKSPTKATLPGMERK